MIAHRALHRAPLQARRRALRPDGARRCLLRRIRAGRRRSTEIVAAMDPHRLPRHRCATSRVRCAERVQDYLAELTAGPGERGPRPADAARGADRIARGAVSGAGTQTPGSDDRPALARCRAVEVVVFSLNSSRYGKLAAQLGTLVIQDLVSAAGERLSEATRGAAAAGARRDRRVLGAGCRPPDCAVARGREPGLSGRIRHPGARRSGPRRTRPARSGASATAAVKIIHRQDVPALRPHRITAGRAPIWCGRRPIQTGGAAARPLRHAARQPPSGRAIPRPPESRSSASRTGEAIVITKQPSAQTRAMRVRPPQRWGRELG